MTTLRKLKSVAEKIGATIEDTKINDSHECCVFSPPGKFFCEGNTHILVDHAYQPWKPDYGHLIERMAYGLEDCTDPECEWCHPDA